jgi:hypothetical protein
VFTYPAETVPLFTEGGTCHFGDHVFAYARFTAGVRSAILICMG